MAALRLPPVTPWAPFEQARERLDRLTRDLAAAGAAHDQLLRERNEAVEADRQALAAAIREDRARPKEGAQVAKVDAKLQAALRDREGLELALQQEKAALHELMKENRDGWLAEIDEKLVPQAQAALLPALDALEKARHEADGLFALRRFLEEGGQQPYKGNVSTRVLALRSRPSLGRDDRGDPYSVEAVLAALRETFGPREAAAEKQREAVGW